MSRNKATKALKPIKDRFLKNEKPENLYLTYALYFVMIFMSALLIFVFLVGMCLVDGSSMNPTLQDGDYLLMTKNPSSVDVGDIVAFRIRYTNKNGKEVEETLIKRVVGVGGDDIVFMQNRSNPNVVDVYRRSEGSDAFHNIENDYDADLEPILRSTMEGKYADKIVDAGASAEDMEKKAVHVDKDYILVLGDNRNNSTDSRWFGLVSVGSVRGKMFYRLKPGSILQKLLLLIYNDESL